MAGDQWVARATGDAAAPETSFAGKRRRSTLADRRFVIDDAWLTAVTDGSAVWVSPRGSGLTYLAVLEDPKAPSAHRKRRDDGRLIVDECVFFAYDSSALTEPGRAKLDDIAARLKAVGTDSRILRIEGHADRRGPKGYNRALSRDRAKAVEGYLTALGIEERSLDIKAYGDSRPLELDASTLEEYQRNRRVEFTIVSAP